MKTIYLDTEFSEGFFKPIWWLPKWFPGNKPRWSIELISIGLVDNEGKEYYAINKDFDRSRCNDWVKQNVLTKLPSRVIEDHESWWYRNYGYDCAEVLEPNPVYKSIAEIKDDIIRFCIGACEISEAFGITTFEHEKKKFFANNELQFKAYYADYDWVLFCTIFGTMMDLPDGFPMYCFDLKQEFDRKMDNLWWVISFKNGDKRLCYGIGDNHIDQVVISKEVMVGLLKNNSDYPKQNAEHNALSDAAWNRDLDNYMAGL